MNIKEFAMKGGAHIPGAPSIRHYLQFFKVVSEFSRTLIE